MGPGSAGLHHAGGAVEEGPGFAPGLGQPLESLPVQGPDLLGEGGDLSLQGLGPGQPEGPGLGVGLIQEAGSCGTASG
jgi:hypothetical protein